MVMRHDDWLTEPPPENEARCEWCGETRKMCWCQEPDDEEDRECYARRFE